MTVTPQPDDFFTAIEAANVGNPGRQRLEAALIDLRRAIREAEDRLAACQERPVEGDAAVARALVLYKLACDLKAERTFVAWDCLQQIERELMWVATPEELRIFWTNYSKEAQAKLKNWRASAVEDIDKLLRPPQAAPVAATERPTPESQRGGDSKEKAPLFTPTVAGLQALMRHVHTASQNRQHNFDLIEKQVHIVTTLLVLVIGWTLALAALGRFDWMDSMAAVSLVSVLPDGVLAGALGALLSIAFKLTGVDSTASVPDVRSLRWVTAARLAIGTAAAFPVLVIMGSGFLNLPGQAAKMYVALCVIAGFSERWFRDTLEGLASRTSATVPSSGKV